MEVRRNELKEIVAGHVPQGSQFVWEVGCGHGHFLSAYAKGSPDKLCIGVDISSDRIGRASKKRDRAHLTNLHFIRAEAEDFLAVLPKGTSFSAVFVLFPDPWPKRRHHKNRVMTSEFLNSVASLCPKGTPLYFRTDHEPYFRAVFSLFRTHPEWTLTETKDLPVEEPTVFEKRATSHFTLVAQRE